MHGHDHGHSIGTRDHTVMAMTMAMVMVILGLDCLDLVILLGSVYVDGVAADYRLAPLFCPPPDNVNASLM